MKTTNANLDVDTKLEILQGFLAYKFKDPALLLKALTHKSYDQINNYEKLEFFGDCLLNLTVSSLIIKKFPDLNEGNYTDIRQNIINNKRLTEIGKVISLERYLRVSDYVRENALNSSKHLISDALEAILAAIYYDSNQLPVVEDSFKHLLLLYNISTGTDVFSGYQYKRKF